MGGQCLHYTDGHSLAMIELLSRCFELLNFRVFSPPFCSCSVRPPCETSVPRVLLAAVECTTGRTWLPKEFTNVWDFHLKLSD